MNTNQNQEQKPQRQTAENPSGEPVKTSRENKLSVENSISQLNQDRNAEEQFKEAQTERD